MNSGWLYLQTALLFALHLLLYWKGATSVAPFFARKLTGRDNCTALQVYDFGSYLLDLIVVGLFKVFLPC